MKVEVCLHKILYEEADEGQKRAWRWLCRELLKLAQQSYRPQLPRGGRVSQRRRGRGVLNESERLNDTAYESPTSSHRD